jgi:hypothetical protein
MERNTAELLCPPRREPSIRPPKHPPQCMSPHTFLDEIIRLRPRHGTTRPSAGVEHLGATHRAGTQSATCGISAPVTWAASSAQAKLHALGRRACSRARWCAGQAR